jgi:hypothetical protein
MLNIAGAALCDAPSAVQVRLLAVCQDLRQPAGQVDGVVHDYPVGGLP